MEFLNLQPNQCLIFSLLLLVLFLEMGTLVIFILVLKSFNNKASRFLELHELEIQYKYDYTIEDVEEEMDNFILTIFSRYLFVKKYNNMNLTVSLVEELDMYNDVMNEVMTRMSPILMSKILTVYNKNSIDLVILDKIVMLVSEYCASCNNMTKK